MKFNKVSGDVYSILLCVLRNRAELLKIAREALRVGERTPYVVTELYDENRTKYERLFTIHEFKHEIRSGNIPMGNAAWLCWYAPEDRLLEWFVI